MNTTIVKTEPLPVRKPKKRRKPTEMQRAAFQNMETAMTMRQAMLEAGYSSVTARKPKNLTETAGFRTLIDEYRGNLYKAGITPEIVAEIQAEGLFSADDKVRLEYIKETKKDLGIYQPDNKPANIMIGIVNKKDYEW